VSHLPLPDLTRYLAEISTPEQQLMRLYGIDEPLVIFDIGACEGEDSIRYTRRFPRARIHSFEPLPANQELIRANFARYGAVHATLVPIALSDRTGETVFHVSSGRPLDEFAGQDWNYGNKSSSLLPPAHNEPMYGWVEFKERITVPTSTLEDYCRAHSISRIDFIHMDVQGAEHLVLQGAGAMLPAVRALWLEVSDQQLYQGQRLRADMETLLRAQGFALAYEERREVEGDQLYLNLRCPRFWPYLLRRRARGFAGRVKRAVLGQTQR